MGPSLWDLLLTLLPAAVGACSSKGSIVTVVTLLSFPCWFLLHRNSTGDNYYPCFRLGGKCSVKLGLFSGKEPPARPGVFTSCLVQFSLGPFSALPGKNQLLHLHKSGLRAFMAFLGIPGFAPCSGSFRDWAWQAKQALSIVSPSALGLLCAQRALGSISWFSPPSLSCAQSQLNQDPAQEKRHFWELTRQL